MVETSDNAASLLSALTASAERAFLDWPQRLATTLVANLKNPDLILAHFVQKIPTDSCAVNVSFSEFTLFYDSQAFSALQDSFRLRGFALILHSVAVDSDGDVISLKQIKAELNPAEQLRFLHFECYPEGVSDLLGSLD